MTIWLKVAKMKIPLMASGKKGPETRVAPVSEHSVHRSHPLTPTRL